MNPYALRHELASALLRRLHLWPSLVASSSVTFTSRPDDSGLRWTVERCVPQHRQLHNDDFATVLAEPLAGPGLPSTPESTPVTNSNASRPSAPVGSPCGPSVPRTTALFGLRAALALMSFRRSRE